MATDKREVELIIRANDTSARTLAAVTNATTKLSDTIDKQVKAAKRGDVALTDLKKTYQDIEEAGKQLIAQDALVQRFQKVNQAVNQVAIVARKAKDAYDALAEEQSYQSTVTAKQDKELRSLAASVTRADKALTGQKNILSTLSGELQRTGIDVNNLAASEARLVQVAQAQAAAQLKSANAMEILRKRTQELNQVNQTVNPFVDNGRTTLSLLQRLRGEILALTAAYVGLQGAIGLVNGVLETVRTQQQVQAKLLASNGNDAQLAGDDYKYLRQQAERLGLYLPTLAKTYSSFAISAKAANMNTSEMRFVFERVAEAGRVMKLDQANMEGIFNAITQMVSKGKIQSEELRGQLGDRLPGAIIYAAKKYEGGVKEYVKQLEKGNVEATSGVLNLARGLDEGFNATLAGTLNSLDAIENRYRNSLDDFRKAIGDAGLTQSYTELLKRLTDFFRSDQGRQFATDIAKAFAALASSLGYVIDNLDTFLTIAETLIGLYLARQFFNMATGAVEFGKSILTLNNDLKKTPSLIGKVQGALIILQAFMASYQIGTMLSGQFETVQKVGIYSSDVILKAYTTLKYELLIIWENLGGSWSDMIVSMINNTSQLGRDVLGVFKMLAEAVGADGIAKSIDDMINKGVFAQSGSAEARIKALREEMQAQLKIIQNATDQQLKEATAAYKKAKAELDKAANTPDPGSRTEDPGGGAAVFDGADGGAKLLAKYKSLLAQVESVEAQSLKKQKDTIESITKGIETQYLALFRKINESGVQGAAELQARLRAAVDVLKSQATAKYAEDQLKKIEAIQQKFNEIEAKLGKAGNREERLKGLEATYRSLYADIAELDGERSNQLKSQLDLMIDQLKVIESQKFANEEVNRIQNKMNDLVSTRNDQIKATTDLVTAGLLSEQEGRERIKKIIENSQPGIEAYAAASREVVESLRGLVDDGVLDAAIAKIDLAATSANRFKTELYSANQANQDLAAGMTSALSESAEGFTEAAFGAQSLGDAIRGAGRAFLDFAANFLRKIAEMIIQQMILNALQNSGYGGAISGGVNAAVAHSGGVVGTSGIGRSRTVAAGMFDNAPKYHSGGLGGLGSDEYAAIIQKNEEILTTDNPRHIFNAGGSSDQPLVVPAPNVNIVNAIDAGSFISEGLASKTGTQSQMNWIRANKKSIQTILSSG